MPIRQRPPGRLLLAALLAVFLGAADAQPPPLSEADVKAGLVFNFARYVEWPKGAFGSPDAPFVICHMGHDRFATAFSALTGRSLKGRTVHVRLGVSPEQSAGCHLAFIAEVPAHGMAAAAHTLSAQGVLTVSDADGFIDSGGAIGIIPGEERLQFEINRDALDRAGLDASSQLLKLAHSLIGRGR